MKRALALILAVVLAFAAGCSQTPASSSQTSDSEAQPSSNPQSQASDKPPVTLSFWGGVPGEYGPQQVLDKFNEEFKDKGIQAEYTRYVNDATGNMKLDTTLLAGNDIDLYMSYSMPYYTKRAQGNMALDLTDYLAKANFDPVAEMGEGAKIASIDGKYYSLPTAFSNSMILANVDMFKEAGIPLPTSWTYDEFREVCKKLTHGEGENKVYGMFWNTQQGIQRMLYPAQQVLGPDYYYKNNNTETNFDNPEFAKALQLVCDTMLVDKSAPTHTASVTEKLSIEGLFLSGKTAMSLGVWAIRSIKDLKTYPHDFETAFLPYPVPDSATAKYTIGDQAIGDFLSINSKSEHIDEAWQFVEWYVEGGMLPFTPYGRVPLYKGIDPKEALESFMSGGEGIIDPETAPKVLEIQDNTAYSIVTTKLPEIQKVVNEEMEAAMSGAKTAQQAMLDSKKRSDEFLK